MRGFESKQRCAVHAVLSSIACATVLGACGQQPDAPPRAPAEPDTPSPPAATRAAELRVRVDRGLVTVRARDANLRDVIDQIAAAHGIAFVAQDALDEPVTVDLVAEPLVPALRKLLGGRSFVLQYKPSEECPHDACQGTLWVLAAETAGVPGTAIADDSKALATLTAALEHHSANVRMDAVEALGLVNSQHATKALTAAASWDTDPSVRAEALYVLSTVQAEAMNPAFERALADADREVRKAAVSALEDLGTQDAVRLLRLALQDTDAVIRATAADALGDIGGKAAREALRPALADGNDAVREAAESPLLPP